MVLRCTRKGKCRPLAVIAVIFCSRKWLALTLSPKEREQPLTALEEVTSQRVFRQRTKLLPLLGGEGRGGAGVRASVLPN